MSIPLNDVRSQFFELEDELSAAALRVLRSGTYIFGEEVDAFEREVAAYLGVEQAVSVNSGTDALTIALRAGGIGPGDEVIVPTFTFFATAESVVAAGATPVFADIELETFNVTAETIEAALTPSTRAIVCVHLFGHPAPMGPILELADRKSLQVFEDAAQAFGGSYQGRKVGTLGRAAAFSFFPSKPLGGFGDGGLIATDDSDVANGAKLLRTHGAAVKYQNELVAYNSRLDALQAALLRAKLPHVDDWAAARQIAAERYHRLLAKDDRFVMPVEAEGARHVWHQYTIRTRAGDRDELVRRLERADIASAIYYPTPLHRLKPFSGLQVALPMAEQASREVLSLPLWHGITTEAQEQVAGALLAA